MIEFLSEMEWGLSNLKNEAITAGEWEKVLKLEAQIEILGKVRSILYLRERGWNVGGNYEITEYLRSED